MPIFVVEGIDLPPDVTSWQARSMSDGQVMFQFIAHNLEYGRVDKDFLAAIEATVSDYESHWGKPAIAIPVADMVQEPQIPEKVEPEIPVTEKLNEVKLEEGIA